MDGLEIDGGKPLHGDIIISGAKNAALPLLCLGLITDAPLILENVPELADTISMEGLLCHLGADVTREGEIVTMRGGARQYDAPYDLVRKMR
ncbi:UDP-N-acetylglucosamine 1-carboxyvinyltransferase, partial [Alphaproteobacteria bacterium]|nr:UDP-N-acetylglucosamine 1-carboxyvinyltransferase [Alphaproteobacteria bacterium]